MFSEMSFGIFAILVFGGIGFLVATTLRRVVTTNEVHIVQSSKKTTSYGSSTSNGNVYYQWPSSLPFIGVSVTKMQISNFDVDLMGYEAYEKKRLPFVVDVKAFFRIADSNVAAQRVKDFSELKEQLTGIVQGAVRTVLATHDLEEIMQGRGTFGDAFTAEVREQLKCWGVEAVKNIELMDIRDGNNSRVIHNIMEKKKSEIEMESRTEVAKNRKLAEISEIEARQKVDLEKQITEQAVSLRTIEKERSVSLEKQSALQSIKDQEALTMNKTMEILKVETVKKAEITRDAKIIEANQSKDTQVILSQARLETEKMTAEAIALNGKAKADAEREMLLAPVEAQTTLAKEIGSNKEYQNYLITIRQVEAGQAVGIEQAKALTHADIKVIANSGDVTSGVKKVTDIFSSKGGTELGGMLEALKNSPAGEAILNKLTS